MMNHFQPKWMMGLPISPSLLGNRRLFYRRFPIFLFLLFLLIQKQLSAQDIPEIIPPSPEAATFAKYGEIPVSTYTGVPNIRLPLYTAKNGDVTVPISLSYHASGIKVDEEASWVGLGWSLNAGGVISRTIVGKDDFESAYWNTSWPDFEKNLTGPYGQTVLPSILSEDCDLPYLGVAIPPMSHAPNSNNEFQPDIYNFNFAGYAGTFVVKKEIVNGVYQVQTNSASEIQIIPDFDPADHEIKSWTVMTPNGFSYIFDQIEYIYPANGIQAPTSWYLSEVTSPTGKAITLNYTTQSVNVQALGALKSSDITPICYTVWTNGSGQTNCGTSFSAQLTAQGPRNYRIPILSEIDFHTGVVKFTSNNNSRQDLPNGNRLDKIEIFEKEEDGDLNTIPSKIISFDYDYFKTIGNPDIDLGASTYSLEHLTWRLKLTQVVNVDPLGNIPYAKCPSHSFTYYDSNSDPSLPAKTSLARDHWGYYNGKKLNTKLHAEVRGYLSNFYPQYIELGGADREANPSTIHANSLKQIIYPTGGNTEFTYESNTYDYWASAEYDDYKDYYPDLKDSDYFSKSLGISDQSDSWPFSIEQNAFPISLNGTAKVELKVTFIGVDCSSLSNSQPAKVFVLDQNGNTVDGLHVGINSNNCVSTPPMEEVYTYDLTPGDYTLVADKGLEQMDLLNVELKWYETPLISYGGGQRIKELRSHDGINSDKDIIKNYVYHYIDNSLGHRIEKEYSYGKRLSRPLYGRFKDKFIIEKNNPNIPCYYENNIQYSQNLRYLLSANSHIPLRGTGGVLGYSKVIEYEGEDMNGTIGTNGKTEYEYHNTPDVIKSYSFRRPPGIPNFPHHNGQLNGMLEKRVIFKKDNYGYAPVQKLENTYSETFSGSRPAIMGMYQEAFEFENKTNCLDGLDPCQILSFIYPAIIEEWPRLIEKRETSYDQKNGESIQTLITYEYDPQSHQVSKESLLNSDQVQYDTEFIYPANTNSGAPAEMWDPANSDFMNMVAVPIEQRSYKNLTLTSTQKYTYVFNSNNKTLRLNTIQQTPSGNTLPRNVNMAYSDFGNVNNIQKEHDAPISFLWGYRESYPTAKVINAHYEDIAYSSFEYIVEQDPTNNNLREDGRWIFEQNGGWNSLEGKTGNSRFDCNSSRRISTTVNINGTYVLSFWAKNPTPLNISVPSTLIHTETTSDGWILYIYEVDMTSSQNIEVSGKYSGNNFIDELRLHPKGAQMSTVCYDLNQRIHTKTDINNRSINFTYDSFGRLSQTKDQNGDLLTEQEYYYYKN